MLKILKYSFFDLMRSRWILFYSGFFMLFTFSLLFMVGDLAKTILSLLNIVLILCPLIAVMTGLMFYYQSKEFSELLLAQPIKRISIFFGQYTGLSLSLTLSILLGIGTPFLIYGIFQSGEILNFIGLIGMGIALSLIFSAIAFLIALSNHNKIKGFGLAILVWLFFAIAYDGFFLLLLFFFKSYPLENMSITMSLLNPIDLARIFILLKLDTSALMGYTGAVFQKFFGSSIGMLVSLFVLLIWIILPILGIKYVAEKKDF